MAKSKLINIIQSLENENKNNKKIKVLIIGAGFAGLSAAQFLKKNNVDFEIIESRKDIGGRIRTFTDWGFPMDLGASWLQSPNSNSLTKIAKKIGMNLIESDYKDSIVFYNGIKIPKQELKTAYEAFKIIYHKTKKESLKVNYDVTLQELYNKFEIKNDMRRITQWWSDFLNDWEFGTNLKNLSARAFFENLFEFDGLDVLPSKGMRPILDYVGKNIKVRLNTKVKKITRKNNEIILETNNGNIYGDYCICTVPLGVLKSNQITFEPELSTEKQIALNNLEMATLNKIYTQWEEPWWNAKSTYIGIIEAQRKFPVTLNYSPHDENTLLTFFHGDEGKRIEALDNEEIIKMLLKNLEIAFGKKIPNPKRFLITKWNKDGNTLGSYSYVSKTANGKEMDILMIPENNLFFAGEHCSVHESGYAQGAYNTGLFQASKILEKIK
jgi:monoamine oxidase